MRILHVMKGCPFPPKGGFESDIWNRFVAMCAMGCHVDVIMTMRHSDPDPSAIAEIERLASRVFIVRRSLTPSSIFTTAPCLAATNRVLASVPLESSYDAVLAESENMAWIFENPRLRARRRFIRVHNDEARYYSTMASAEERPHWKAFFAMEALRYRRYSTRAFRQCDGMWFISGHERDLVAASHPELQEKCEWLPPAIEKIEPVERRSSHSKNVLCVGSLNVSLNREAIRWYLKGVHPALQADPDYRLIIAGGTRGSDNAKRFAGQLNNIPACEVHLDRPDLQPLYQQCAVIVNSMQRGAGVKMKTVHAVQQMLPLVTTPAGAEGSGFRKDEHICIADNAKDFARNVKSLLDNPDRGRKMAERAYAFLAQHYDQQAQIGRLLDQKNNPPFNLSEDEPTVACSSMTI
jgi:polysaccharide biosynthesis protein PslH